MPAQSSVRPARRVRRSAADRTPAVPSGPVAGRIVAAARRDFFAHGFARCTMDDLAQALGMSKKTLYAHFPTKEALVDVLVAAKTRETADAVRAAVEAPGLAFGARVHAMMAQCLGHLAEISPVFLRDLERQLPAVYARIEAVRRDVLPKVWGRLLAEGVAAGLVRRELEPAFVSEFALLAVQGLLRPEALERHALRPPEVLDRVLSIIFAGILTPAGRKTYENKTRR